MWHLKFAISCSMICAKCLVHLSLFARRQMPTSLNHHSTLQKVLIMSLKFPEASKSPPVRPAQYSKAQENMRDQRRKVKNMQPKQPVMMLHVLLSTLISAIITLVIQFSIRGILPPVLYPILVFFFTNNGVSVWRLAAKLLVKNWDTLAKQHE